MRARIAIFVALAGGLAWTGVATATNIAAVLYKPPKITLVDQPEAASIEDVVVTKDGQEYSFAQPTGLVQHPQAEPGCTDDYSTDYRCPTAGIKTIKLKLGALNDGASIDLGSRADKVKQVLQGGSGTDTLTGGPGPQRLLGGENDDTITGGPGPDVIDGGGGTDICDGGGGRDTIRNCE